MTKRCIVLGDGRRVALGAYVKAWRQGAKVPKFFECGCCGHMHSPDFWGDCRQDSERFTCAELDDTFGQNGWEQVEQESAW